MDTDKITKFYEDAIIKINNASENDKNSIADYLIGYYTNMSSDNLKTYLLTREEANEIVNKLKEYKEKELASIMEERTSNTDKVTKFYEDAIIKINNASENDKNSIADYLIGYYTNMSSDNLKTYLLTREEANEIVNKLKEYKENGFSQEISNAEVHTNSSINDNKEESEEIVEEEKKAEVSEIRPVNINKEEIKTGEDNVVTEAEVEQPIEDISLTELFDNANSEKSDDIEEVEAVDEKQKSDTENENMRVTRAVDYIIYSSEKLNLDDALKYIQEEIDKYNNYNADKGSRYSDVEAKEIAKKLELYKQGLIDDYEKFKTLDEAVNGHIKYAETLGLDERIGYIDKTIDYYNNTSSDKFTKEDTAYITKRLNAYKSTLEEKLNNKDDKNKENKENKESKIKVVGKRVCKWISKHKRQILIGVGCAAIVTGLFAVSASAIPTLMAANSANWWIAKSVGNVALMNTLHANNIALGAKIGAIFSAKTGAWTISAGSIIGKSALVSSVAGISGFSVSSIVSALHKKFVPKTNSNGEEVISKEEAKIYYDKGYKKGLKKGRNETNDREYNDGYDDGYNAALEDIEKEGNVDESSNDKNKTSFQTLRNTFSKLFNRTKKKKDDEEWEPIVSTGNNNSDRPSLSEREDWQKHFANNGVENPGAKKTPIIDAGVISTDEFEQSATEKDVAETVATSVEGFMNAESTKEEVPTTQEGVTKKVSLEKSKTKDPFGALAEDMSELYFEKLGEKPVSPTNSIVYDANNDKNDDIWTIAHRAGGYYIENSKKADIDAEIKALKDKLVLDTPEKEKDWELGFKAGIEDYNKKNMTSEYLDLEQLNNLNPGANITFDELHPNILYSDIDANLLTLPNGWYYNDKNGITNKHNTETGVYQTYTVEKYQEDRDKLSSHKR